MAIGKLKHKLHIQLRQEQVMGEDHKQFRCLIELVYLVVLCLKQDQKSIWGSVRRRITHIITTRFNRNIDPRTEYSIDSIKKVEVSHKNI